MPPVDAAGPVAPLAPSAAAVERAAALLADAGVAAEAPSGRLRARRGLWLGQALAAGARRRRHRRRDRGTAPAPCSSGRPRDREIARAIQSALDPAVRASVVDLVGRTDVATLMAMLARCAVVVANDSGAMHVASAVGRPVVAIFGPTDERATAPMGPHTLVRHDVFCRPCLLRACPIDHRCLRRIDAADVVEAVARHL